MKKITLLLMFLCASLYASGLFNDPMQIGGANGLRVLNGNVGIGTTNPLAQLQVEGSVAISTNAASGYKLNVDGATLGLGLRVAAPSTSLFNDFAITEGNTVWLGFLNSTTGVRDGGISYDVLTDTMSFRTNSSTRMVINGAGNVGIGTVSPGATLEVAGTILGALPSGTMATLKALTPARAYMPYVDTTNNTVIISTGTNAGSFAQWGAITTKPTGW